MRVPEYAQPIRVRWYRVTNAPQLDGHPYTSSDWDEQPGMNPDQGEQWGTRMPFTDWRDCSPPPWFPNMDCANCPNGAANSYILTVSGLAGSPECSDCNGTFGLSYLGSCTWKSPPFFPPSMPSTAHTWTMTVRPGGALNFILRRTGTNLASWLSDVAWDCHSPVTVSSGGSGLFCDLSGASLRVAPAPI